MLGAFEPTAFYSGGFYTPGEAPVQIASSGSLKKVRRKFKPVILFDHWKEQELESLNGSVIIALVIAPTKLREVHAKGQVVIDALAELRSFSANAIVSRIKSYSSWNDPSDDEIIAIFALLE